MKPRKPNKQEILDLRDYLFTEIGGGVMEGADVENVDSLMDGAAIAVFDDYSTDCPGYSGRVILVMWSGAPEMYDAFNYQGTKLHRINQDPSFAEETSEII